MTNQQTIDRTPHLEEAQRLLRVALETIFPGQYALTITPDVSEDGNLAIEVGKGEAALEPVEVTVTSGLSSQSSQAIYWRVYREVDASDPSVGLFGSELEPAPLDGHALVWQLPRPLTTALSHDLGVSDDVLQYQIARHNLVVARVRGQDGCYSSLSSAIRCIICDLMGGIIESVIENEAITIAIERGEYVW